MATAAVKQYTRIVSKCTVKPAEESSMNPYYLTRWDIMELNYPYVQIGLLFNKPADDQPINTILDQLKNSLSATLTHFFPLSGRLVTQNIQHPQPSYSVCVDCNHPAAGAEFIHAVASDVTVSDILTPTDVPAVIMDSLFALRPWTPNIRGHTIPLLIVQVTQLVDGIFIGFSINHALVDATSFWNFVNSYSEICRSQQFQNNRGVVLSRPPVFVNNQVYLPGSHPPDLGFVVPPRGTYRQRVFHLTSKAVAHLKAKANRQDYGAREISSFQAFAALIWRSTTRARGFRDDQLTTCVIPIDTRSKLEPPLPRYYFGNCLKLEFVSSTVDELLSNNFGWAARKLHNQIISCDSHSVRSYLENFSSADCTMNIRGALCFGNSPRLDVYGNDFGWGSPIAVRNCDDSDEADDCIVQVMPGRDDEGSVDLMICLLSKFMNALELDDEFMDALSPVPISKL